MVHLFFVFSQCVLADILCYISLWMFSYWCTCNSNQRHRGGFVIFSKVRLDITSEVTNNVQIACFEFMNLLFIFVHRRPSETPISLFKECLSQKFRQQKKPTIVMGDFNVNLKCDNSSFLRLWGQKVSTV